MLRRALDFLHLAAAYLAAFFVFAIFAVMILQSVLREFGVRTGGTDDVVGWFCAAAAYLVLANAFKRGDLVRVTLLLERLEPRARRIAEALSLACASAFALYLAWWSIVSTYDTWRLGDMANGLIVLPMWIPQLSLPIGAVFLALAVLDEFFIVLIGRVPTYQLEIEARHARGDFSEDA
jgi:TRAP-type C4-dicarboxylate transport system permease small subunit